MTSDLFQLYLKLRYKGVYNKEKSSDGQFTGGFYTDVYMLGDKEYHVNFDDKYIHDISLKSYFEEDVTKLTGSYTVKWPFFKTLASNT